MRLTVGTKVIFDQSGVIDMAASGLLVISVGDGVKLHAGQADLLAHFKASAADEVTAVSLSGYELQCLEIDPVEEEWTFEVIVAPDEA